MFWHLVVRAVSLPRDLLRAVARAVDAVLDTLHWQWIRRNQRSQLKTIAGKGGWLPTAGRTARLLACSLTLLPSFVHADDWHRLVNEGFDAEDESHVALLRRLWVASSFPEDEFSTMSGRWTSIGFQSDDAPRDLRGGGVLSLRCMVYFAEAYPDDYARLSKERPAGRYFPWSAAFINVSFMLLDVLGIRDLRDSAASRSKVTYGFLARVGDGPGAVERAFVELACEAITEVDRVFAAEHATYFEFPRVRAAVFEELAGRVGRVASSGGEKKHA